MTNKIRRGELSYKYIGIKVIKNINMSKNEFEKRIQNPVFGGQNS